MEVSMTGTVTMSETICEGVLKFYKNLGRS